MSILDEILSLHLKRQYKKGKCEALKFQTYNIPIGGNVYCNVPIERVVNISGYCEMGEELYSSEKFLIRTTKKDGLTKISIDSKEFSNKFKNATFKAIIWKTEMLEPEEKYGLRRKLYSYIHRRR